MSMLTTPWNGLVIARPLEQGPAGSAAGPDWLECASDAADTPVVAEGWITVSLARSTVPGASQPRWRHAALRCETARWWAVRGQATTSTSRVGPCGSSG